MIRKFARSIALCLFLCTSTAVEAATPVVDNFGHSSQISNATSIDIAKPTGVVNGDLLIILVANDAGLSTAQWDNSTLKPTGFTFINTAGSANEDAHVGAFWKIATGSDEGDPINVPSATSAVLEGWWLRVTGAHASAPLDVTGVDVESGAAVSSLAITEVTTTVNDCLAFYWVVSDGGDTGPHSVSGTGWTETAEDLQGVSGGLAASWGTKGQASAGLTGDATVTFSATDGASGFQFGIAPAAAGGAATLQRRRRTQ